MDYATMQPREERDPNVILKIPFDKSISLCDDQPLGSVRIDSLQYEWLRKLQREFDDVSVCSQS